MAKESDMLEELRKIRSLLEPKTAPPPPKGLWKEFMDFLSKYKVLGLAVGFIMALYLGNLVLALVKDFLLPAIGLILPTGNLATFKIPVPFTDLDASGNAIDTTWKGQMFAPGDFLVALITFIIVAFVIFLIVKIAARTGIE